jgi:dGTPase
VLKFVHGREDFPDDLPAGKVRNGYRSIECLVMDWSDDAAYSLNDIIDGAHAGFINIERLERWAANAGLSGDEAAHVDGLLKAIRDEKLEARLGRKIGDFIGAAELVERPETFMSAKTNRYRYSLKVDEAMLAESSVYKRIAFDLVFRSPQMQQLDHKADHLLRGLFGVLEKTYIFPNEPGKAHMRLVPEAVEKAIWQQETANERARLVCDHIASMTDRFAVRVYKRLFDPDFGSILDLI